MNRLGNWGYVRCCQTAPNLGRHRSPRCYPPRRWEAEAGGGHRAPPASVRRWPSTLNVMNALWHTLRPELRDEDISGLPRVPVWSLDQTEELLRLTQQCLSAFRRRFCDTGIDSIGSISTGRVQSGPVLCFPAWQLGCDRSPRGPEIRGGGSVLVRPPRTIDDGVTQ
jgi:hypothetical protein